MGRIVGSLPGPCFPGNSGAGDLLEGQLFAYGVGFSVVVVDVPRLRTACVLHSGHGRAPVTAVSWNPECHSRDLSPAGHLRLASGDREGNVVVWDVLQVGIVCKLGNPKPDAEGSRGVKSLAWILKDPCLLAVVLGPATLVVWDLQGGSVVWQKDLQGVGSMHSLCVDALDRRCMCASGNTGVCIIFEFEDIHKSAVHIKQYRVTSRVSDSATQSSGNVHCIFPATRGLLLVMLNREMILFDVEFGQPIYSFRLQSSHAPFLRILSVTGEGYSAGGGIQGGIDEIHCAHEDGKVSVWNRSSEGLSFMLTSSFKLLPQPLRGPNASASKLIIATAASMTWRGVGIGSIHQNTDLDTRGLNKFMPNPSLLVITVMSNGHIWQWDLPLKAHAESPKLAKASGEEASELGDTEGEHEKPENGAEVDEGEQESPIKIADSLACSAAPECPSMLRVLSNLPAAVTTLTVLSKPLLQSDLSARLNVTESVPTSDVVTEDGPEETTDADPADDTFESTETPVDGTSVLNTESVAMASSPCPVSTTVNAGRGTWDVSTSTSTPVMAVVTAGGTLEVIPVHRGCVTAISLEVLRSFSIHKERARSVRWLGCSPLVVSFCTEKIDQGWKNSLMITDVRTGESSPFREMGSENAAMIGIRTSPSGRYILLLMKDAPAEIWLVSGLRHVQRGRQVEIPFTAVEWALPEGPSYDPISIEHFENWGCNEGEEWEGGISAVDFPPETLVFAVNDGRVGIFSIKGKMVIDSKLRRPLWGMLPSGAPAPLKCISVVAMGSHVIFGDVEGNLTQWDMTSGQSVTIPTDCGPIRRLQVIPVGGSDVKAKVAVLSSSWQCTIWEMDHGGNLSATKFRSSNRYLDVSWIPNPTSSGSTSLLAGVTEEGSLAVMDTDSTGTLEHSPRFLSSRDEAHPIQNGAVLGGSPWLGSSLLLPNPLRLLLRLLLQVGTPLEVLRKIISCDQSLDVDGDDDMEREIFSLLPDSINSFSWTRRMNKSKSIGGAHPCQRGEDGMESEDSAMGKESSVEGTEPHGHVRRKNLSLHSSGHRSTFVRTRNMSLASEVLASYESAESRTKVILRKMKLAVKKKVKSNQGAANKRATPRLTAEWGESLFPMEQGVMLPSCETLLDVVRAIAAVRAQGNLLLHEEWGAYEAAMETSSTALRMAVASQVAGCWEEIQFWLHLPKTLSEVRKRAQDVHGWKCPDGVYEHEQSPIGETCSLWMESMTLASSAERVHWHESLPRTTIDSHPELQDRRLLEYVCLGDYKTAVGFLLASAPEGSVRYYRDSLCALALAAGDDRSGGDSQTCNALHLQVAKVVSAHAASLKDSLLAVPLLCSAGLPQDAVSLLQDSGLWNYAATLTASRLEGVDHALSCFRWAQHVLSKEGSVWRSAGILVSGGCLQEAARILKHAGYPDCASALCECCMEAGLVIAGKEGPSQLFDALSTTQFTRIEKKGVAGQRRLGTSEEEQEELLKEIAAEFVQYCAKVVNVF